MEAQETHRVLFSSSKYPIFVNEKGMAGFHSGIMAFLLIYFLRLLCWSGRRDSRGSVFPTIKQCGLISVSRIMEIWTDPIPELTYSLWMMCCAIWLWYEFLKEVKYVYIYFNYTHTAQLIVSKYWAAVRTELERKKDSKNDKMDS